MSSCVALLRGINVGGRQRLAMADLRDLAGRLGLRQTRTLLQSGNLLFEAPALLPNEIERQFESALRRQLGFTVDVLVRTAEAWQAAINANPLSAQARADPAHFLVVFFKSDISLAQFRLLQKGKTGPEIMSANSRELYLFYPAGIGNSLLTSKSIESRLGQRGTARNWNTILKIRAALDLH